MINDQRIIASYWTIAGDCYPGGKTEISPYGFEIRVAAAAEAGYRGIGLVHADIRHLRNTLGFRRVRTILDTHGIRDLEVEIFSDWFADGGGGHGRMQFVPIFWWQRRSSGRTISRSVVIWAGLNGPCR